MEERVASIAKCRYVDEVIPNAPWIFDPAWIEMHKIHLVVHGDDYSQEQFEYYYKVPIEMGIFRSVPYTQGISTSEIIRRNQGKASLSQDAFCDGEFIRLRPGKGRENESKRWLK